MSRIWPSAVPYEQNADGASLPSTYRPPLSSPVEAGPDIMRRRPGPRSTLIPWKSVPLSEQEWERLERFFRVDCFEGTVSFQMPIFRPGRGYVNRTCQIQGGQWNTDMSNYPVIFVGFNLFVFNL